MRTRPILPAVLALIVAACGTGDNAGAEDTTTTTTAATTTTAMTTAGVSTAETPLGEVLVGPNGMTLYAFTVDDPGLSNCYDACAEAWLPLSGDTPIADNLDATLFSTIERTDGTTQLVISDWPLYYFAGDTEPGDVNGQDVEGVWFVVDADGNLVGADEMSGDTTEGAGNASADDGGYGYGAPEPSGLQVAETELGPTLVDASGMTLYGFTQDTPTASACSGSCADNWPPVPGDTKPPADLDGSLFTTITRDDGSTQLVFGDWPLYRFVGDTEPGDINGQGINEVWFVIAPDATLYR